MKGTFAIFQRMERGVQIDVWAKRFGEGDTVNHTEYWFAAPSVRQESQGRTFRKPLLGIYYISFNQVVIFLLDVDNSNCLFVQIARLIFKRSCQVNYFAHSL